MIKKTMHLIALMILAFLSAMNYSVFVFPNSFAPAGIDGICTMIQDICKINMGYLALLVNIPLMIAGFFFLNKEFALKSSVYVLAFSLSLIVIKFIDISKFQYVTETGTSIVLAPIASGTIRGILYNYTLKLNGSSGGIDIIAALVKKKKPHLNLMNIIFFFNILVALSSYFVYGMKPEPVICSIIYSFLTSHISNNINSSENKTVKFEIITPDAEKLCTEISDTLHQPATIMDAQGAFSGSDTKVIICVVKKFQVPHIEDLLSKYENCVVFKSIVNSSAQYTNNKIKRNHSVCEQNR